MLDRLTQENGGLMRAIEPGGLVDQLLDDDGLVERLLAEDGVADRLLAEGGLIDTLTAETGRSNSSRMWPTRSIGWRPGWRHWSRRSMRCVRQSSR